MPRLPPLLDAGPDTGPQGGKLRLPFADPCGGPQAQKFPDPPKVPFLGGARTTGAEVLAHISRREGREAPVDVILDPLSRFPALHLLTLHGTL